MRRLPHLLIAFIALRTLEACSVPQPSSDRQSTAPTIPNLIEAGHYRRAAATLDATPLPADASPHDVAQRQYLQSRIALALGQYDPALQLAEKSLAAEPQNAAFHLQVAAVDARLAQHAGLFKQISLAKRAKKELDDAIALEPKRPDSVYGLVMFHEFAPALIGGDKAAAQKFAEDLTALDPARGYLAQAALAKDRSDPAAEAVLIRKAVAANPDSYAAHIALASLAKRVTPPEPDTVDEQACLALYLDPTRSEAWQTLAELAVASECWPEVTGLLQTAARFNPDDKSPAFAAAAAMVAAGKNLETAQALLTTYLEAPPEGDEPSPARAHYQLALLSEKRSQPQDAIFHLRAAIDQEPGFEDARKELKRIEHAAPSAAP